tara:strand:- start:989 stop:1105 length:117 start_codon:yes stop_codon:yes gene_type:complete
LLPFWTLANEQHIAFVNLAEFQPTKWAEAGELKAEVII